MLNWKTFGEDENQLKGESKLIVEKLGGVRKSFFRRVKNQRSKRTKLICVALSLLGDEKLDDKPHYRVMSHRLPKWMTQKRCGIFKNVEWLYDLHWYSEAEPTCYKLLRMHLVVECEWDWERKEEKRGANGQRDPYGAIKYDFQKLLVANADLRLMIYRIADENRRSDLDEYFENVANKFENLQENSKFLFIAFEEKTKKLHYAEMGRNPSA
jgi:hypothetical protein